MTHTSLDEHQFLQKLQNEAALQAQLYEERLLPVSLDRITAGIGRYPWQTVLVVSGIAAALVELFRYWWFV